jgi:hypothetical protein
MFEALTVHNIALPYVQKFHFLIASLKNEAKYLISKLQIAKENFFCCLATSNTIQQQTINSHDACQAYMSDAPSQKGRHIITAPVNHVSNHVNTLQALSLNVPVQDLMSNHLMLATLDPETQQEWELITASCARTPMTAELVTFL